jgi:hypothetical protein
VGNTDTQHFLAAQLGRRVVLVKMDIFFFSLLWLDLVAQVEVVAVAQLAAMAVMEA